jgi:CopG family nickel-responsive transcriptional regulator
MQTGAMAIAIASDAHVARLSVSLPAELLGRLDLLVSERALPNRSQFIAELIRHAVAADSASRSNTVLAGTITLIYRAASDRVREALAQVQSSYVIEIISSQHVFLENLQSLEVLLVQGPTKRLQGLCDELRQIRGVLQINLVTTTALLPPLHAHGSTTPRRARAQSPRRSQ